MPRAIMDPLHCTYIPRHIWDGLHDSPTVYDYVQRYRELVNISKRQHCAKEIHDEIQEFEHIWDLLQRKMDKFSEMKKREAETNAINDMYQDYGAC